MHFLTRRPFRKLAIASLAAASAALLASCASTPSAPVKTSKRSKEYFPESVYGVKASPRVSNKRSGLPRGGGRDQVGKPYKVKGNWYHPKEQPGYRNKGMASWYGDAFHGRLTANGEVYDMTHLTAAHPTMPLPSYARVTNTKNGASVIVRVNDRGPFERGRVIDLSKRAAELLDYTHSGVAKVEVEYIGRAPLDGQDDSYLMASYRPGRDGAPADPGGTIATGVMVAMAGSTPAGDRASAFPGVMTTTAPAAPAAASPTLVAANGFGLPEFGPIVPERPFDGPPAVLVASADLMSYADMRVGRAATAFAAFDRAADASTADAFVAAYRAAGQDRREDALHGALVSVGTFADAGEARAVAAALAGFGRVETAVETDGTALAYSISLRADGRFAQDDVLREAWAAGAPDAFVVRP